MGILYITEYAGLMDAGAPGGHGQVPQEPPGSRWIGIGGAHSQQLDRGAQRRQGRAELVSRIGDEAPLGGEGRL